MGLIALQSTKREWFTFLREFQEYEKKILLKIKQDELLDNYFLWLKTGEENLRHKLLHLVKELFYLSPQLNFANLLMKLEKIEI